MIDQLPAYSWALPLLGLPVLYALWTMARQVVRWGFFLLYGTIGTGLAQLGLISVDGGDNAWLYSISAGVSFACVCSAIRARIMRVVGIAFIVAVVALVGWQFYSKGN
jgi:hypothetical protein